MRWERARLTLRESANIDLIHVERKPGVQHVDRGKARAWVGRAERSPRQSVIPAWGAETEGTRCPQGSEVTGSSVGFVEEREVGAQGASQVVQC